MNRTHAVIDDFLEPQEHLDLWDAFQRAMSDPARLSDWNRTYQRTEGPALPNEPGPPQLRALSEKLFALMTGDPPVSIDPWTGFTQSAWTYRPGAGLEWHSDKGYLAGYIYYMHKEWRASWGGELLVATGDTSSSDGVFIQPRPNRLVLLRGGTMHCIKNVESAAGKAFRASMSGFFFCFS